MLQFSFWRKATYQFYFHCDTSLPRDYVYWMRKWDTSTCDAEDKGNLPDLLITCKKLPRPVLTGSPQPLTPQTTSNPAESSFFSWGQCLLSTGTGCPASGGVPTARLQSWKFPLQAKPRLPHSAKDVDLRRAFRNAEQPTQMLRYS